MEPVTLEELKAFARVDLDHDDVLITSLGIAAREYVEQATGRQYVGSGSEPIPEKGKLAIMALAAHWYEFREPVIVSAVTTVPMHVRSLIHQLRDWSESCDEETAA